MDIWEEMYLKAREEYHPESVSPFIDAHHVVAAVQSESLVSRLKMTVVYRVVLVGNS